jgi:hypothetical protein
MNELTSLYIQINSLQKPGYEGAIKYWESIGKPEMVKHIPINDGMYFEDTEGNRYQFSDSRLWGSVLIAATKAANEATDKVLNIKLDYKHPIYLNEHYKGEIGAVDALKEKLGKDKFEKFAKLWQAYYEAAVNNYVDLFKFPKTATGANYYNIIENKWKPWSPQQ